MPALTHGRVINGFNLLPREILYTNKGNVSACDKPVHCGKPLQYTNMQLGKTCGRVSNSSSTDKFANTVTVGRSFASKRAISRRVANITVTQNNNSNSSRKFNYCSMIPTRNFGIDDNIKLCCKSKGNSCSE